MKLTNINIPLPMLLSSSSSSSSLTSSSASPSLCVVQSIQLILFSAWSWCARAVVTEWRTSFAVINICFMIFMLLFTHSRIRFYFSHGAHRRSSISTVLSMNIEHSHADQINVQKFFLLVSFFFFFFIFSTQSSSSPLTICRLQFEPSE